MKAIFKYSYLTPKTYILHTNVVEVEKRCGNNREYRCLDCGQQWTQTLNSPQILSEEVERNINEYYPYKIIRCGSMK